MSARRSLATALAAAALTVTACSSADEDPTAGDENATTTAPASPDGAGESATTTVTGGDGQDGGGSGDERGDGGTDERAVDAATPDEDEVLGTATARLPAAPADDVLVPLRLDVVALEHLRGMVELRVVLTHEGDDDQPAFAPYDTFTDPRLGEGRGRHSLSGAALVDAEEGRMYLALVDSEGACLCTGRLDALSLPPGDSVELFADIGGLPEDVEQVEVRVPGFPTVGAVDVG